LELIYESCRAILHGIALLISDDVSLQSKRDSGVAMSQLPLHNGKSCTVRKQCTSSPVSQAVESGTRDAESIEQWMRSCFSRNLSAHSGLRLRLVKSSSLVPSSLRRWARKRPSSWLGMGKCALLALDFTEPIFRVAESTLWRTRISFFAKSMSAIRSPSVSPIRKPKTAATAKIVLNGSGATVITRHVSSSLKETLLRFHPHAAESAQRTRNLHMHSANPAPSA
jgi:hypothetical protein